MELPKNVTQIGETDKSCKIYVEDYVVSYMKQMNRYAEDKEIAIALYGKCSAEQAVTYCFVYGAAKMDFLQRAVKHLSQAQEQEIERLHRKYFGEYEFVGYILLNGEMIEGIYLKDKSGCHFVKGYACFYEKNDCMLAYMLDTRNEESKPEEYNQSKYNEIRSRQEERRQQYTGSEGQADKESYTKSGSEIEKRMKSMRFAAASMFVLLCMVSVVTLQTDGIAREAGQKIKNLISGVFPGNYTISDSVDAMSEDTINTLVAEEQLAAAIKQENELQQTNAEVATPIPETVITEPITAVPPTATPAITAPPTISPEVTDEPPTSPIPESTISPSPIPAQSEKVLNVYTVQTGDTLIGISRRLYGSEAYVDIICELNNISNPDNIQMGQKILLP